MTKESAKKMVKVRATARGLYGHIQEIGDEFDVPEGTKGSWFVPVTEDKAKQPAKDD